MSCFPRTVWADQSADRYPERRHDPHVAANRHAVVAVRHVTHAGIVELPPHV